MATKSSPTMKLTKQVPHIRNGAVHLIDPNLLLEDVAIASEGVSSYDVVEPLTEPSERLSERFGPID